MVDQPNWMKIQVLETTCAITAFVLMWIGSMQCNFIAFTDTSGTSEPITLEYGIWFYRSWSLVASNDGTYIVESCHQYPDWVEIDGSWKAAMAFSVITTVLGILVFIVSVISACTTGTGNNPDNKPVTFGWMAPCYLLTAICQGLTLLLLNSNACRNNDLKPDLPDTVSFPDTCSIARGAKLTISATSFWLAAAFASFMAVRAARREAAKAMAAGEEASLTEPLAP